MKEAFDQSILEVQKVVFRPLVMLVRIRRMNLQKMEAKAAHSSLGQFVVQRALGDCSLAWRKVISADFDFSTVVLA